MFKCFHYSLQFLNIIIKREIIDSGGKRSSLLVKIYTAAFEVIMTDHSQNIKKTVFVIIDISIA